MAPPPHEEVVEIDGDTSSDEEPPPQQQRLQHEEEEDEEEVVVITPKSRKRRRQSAIIDEDDEGEASQSTAAASAPLSHAKPLEEIDDDDEDDEDEIEIIQVATPGSRDGGSASKRKSRRLTVLESDEEPDSEESKKPRTSTSPGLGPHSMKKKLEVEPVRRQSLSRGTPTPSSAQKAQESASSSSRRSSRIERKREEKEKLGSSARKLEFLSLDNCLDRPSATRLATAEDDDDEFIVDDEDEDEEEEEEEEEDEAPRPKAKAKSRPRAESKRERAYADGDDDLDDFLANDDEVEYMDDDEEGVMEQPHSSADEMDEDADEARAVMQSREPSEWFAIYLRYLEECILDEELDNKIRTNKLVEYRLFEQAKHHIERQLCSRRDALRSSVVWNEDIMEGLHFATKFHSTRCTATTDCQACRRANHYATQLVQFGGFACDARELYKDNWVKKLRRAVRELEPVRGSFELGSVCHARTLGYWQLLHAKHFWAAIVDDKRRECSDGHGRITEDERKPFYKAEYGRYKRLIAIVDKFSSETSQSVYFMPNVWKKVHANHVHSEFLPSGALARGGNGDAPRRGTMDSLVGDSDAEETVDEEEEEQEDEEEQEREEIEIDEVEEKPLEQMEESTESADEQREAGATNDKPKPTTRKRMWQRSILSTLTKAPTSGDQTAKNVKNEPNGESPKMKAVDDIEAEDLLCLVCRQNQRDGAIAHGNYLHFYCCYRCAKRQHAAKHGCMVCDRPIDRVLRILPLSKEARSDILKQQQAQ